jgi:hypothetical protein
MISIFVGRCNFDFKSYFTLNHFIVLSMKKIIILVLISTFNAFAFSQFTSVTPKVGMTVSNMKDYFEKYKFGYLIGASAEYKLSEKFVLKPELLLEQKGGQDKLVLSDENGWPLGKYNVYLTSNYLNLPILLKYSPFNGNKIYFTAGGYAGYLLWTSRKTVDPEGNSDFNNNFEKASFNQWDVGFSLGSGIDIPLNEKSGIQIDVKYERALLNSAFFSTGNTFSLSVGYIFKTGVNK